MYTSKAYTSTCNEKSRSSVGGEYKYIYIFIYFVKMPNSNAEFECRIRRYV